MHELSIVSDLVALADENLLKNGASCVSKMEIKIGRLSGVEPHYLSSCFDVFKEGTSCDKAELVIHTQEIIIRCDECGFEGELEDNIFICPRCSSSALKVIDGEEMYLMRLEMH